MQSLKDITAQIYEMVSEKRLTKRAELLAATDGQDTPEALEKLLADRKQSFMLKLPGWPEVMTVTQFSDTFGTSDGSIQQIAHRLRQCSNCPPEGGECDTIYDQEDEQGRRPVYTSEGIGWKRCPRWREYLIRHRLEHYGVPKDKLDVTLVEEIYSEKLDANGNPTQITRPYAPIGLQVNAYAACRTISETLSKRAPKGLLLTGPTGTGKTHLVCATLRAIIAPGKDEKRDYAPQNRITTAQFSYVPRLITELSPQRDYAERMEVIERALSVDLLILDDVGGCRINEYERDQLMFIIHERHAAQKSLFVTSNEDLAMLSERLGERLMSRLKSATAHQPIPGPDQRTVGG
jgi:DNA replication protein DnaC